MERNEAFISPSGKLLCLRNVGPKIPNIGSEISFDMAAFVMFVCLKRPKINGKRGWETLI